MTGPGFHLDVTTQPDDGVVRLKLTDDAGRHLAANEVRLRDHRPALWEGLFDTRSHVRRYAGSTLFAAQPASQEEIVDRLGVFLGRHVLGTQVLDELGKGIYQRTLVVRLPDTEKDVLAAAFARVPWEIARAAPGKPPLMTHNLALRTVMVELEDAPWTPVDDEETVRVLLVFAEAPGSRPLAMRQEREQLLTLFRDQVLTEKKVEVDVLCHGVTRAALAAAVTERGGYQVIHWSGHGHRDLLEIRGEKGERAYLTGEGLVRLIDAAGGFVPRLFFLSACLSGSLLHVRDRAAFEAALGEPGVRRAEAETGEPEDVDEALERQSGYTGTALELRRAGVPQVIAMRYEVGDAYARDLAKIFYERLLADPEPKPADVALGMARRALLEKPVPGHDVLDHATPMLFGPQRLILRPPRGRSPALRRWRPQPQPLLPGSRELDPPPHFVGRGAELTELREGWLAAGPSGPAVAVVQGLAGLGKTALAAEAVHLWHRRFDGVFAFQSKPTPLGLDELLRQLDLRLTDYSRVYRELCDERPNAGVFLPPSDRLKGRDRYRLLRDNLLEALRSERLLVVLDNFETQLESVPTDGAYACRDPEWEELLRHLADGLPETGSRLLVTTRHRPAALAAKALWLPLGPLPMDEAVLFLQSNEALRRLAFGDEEGGALAMRLLEVSRGHPLILDRLGTLAGDRKALSKALDELEKKGLDRLPDVFAAGLSEAERERERVYLEDVAVGSVDLLLGRLSAAARGLLWVVTLASEPVGRDLLEGAWSGQSPGPLLAELTAAGLVAEESEDVYGFHELVRERVAAWMAAHPEEQGGRTEEQVWEAYGVRYGAAFNALLSSGEEGARERAVEAGRRGLSYLVRARAFARLGSFASGLVTSTRDPRLLRGVIAELEGVADQLPAGQDRWSVRTYLADAFNRAGRPDAALALYEQAAAEAEEAGHWAHVGWICQNWANALGDAGQLDGAKATCLRSAEAKEKAGLPRVNVVGSELEALRIDVMQGDAERALPEIERRLREVRAWWQRHRGGESVPEAPEPVFLGRALVSGLDIAREANLALERWQACLDLLEETEETKRTLGEGKHELAGTRFNQYGPLLRLGRLDDAQRLLEGCLAVFREVNDLAMQSKVLSALADLWDKQGDRVQAVALERQALAICNRLPDLADRSASHGNLSNYLDRSGATEEAVPHLLAAIVYSFITNHRQHLSIYLNNLAIHMRRAASSGGQYALPRLAELLERPEFDPLKQVLKASGVVVEELQAGIDQLVEQVRRQVGSEKASG